MDTSARYPPTTLWIRCAGARRGTPDAYDDAVVRDFDAADGDVLYRWHSSQPLADRDPHAELAWQYL